MRYLAILAVLLCSSAYGQCADGSCSERSMTLREILSGREWKAARPPRPSEIPAEPSTPAPTTPAPSKPAEIDYERLTTLIVEKLAADGRFKGPPGPKGDKGDTGPVGPPGADAVVDYDQIALAVIAKLPPQRLQLLDENGALIDEGQAPLGQPIKLRFTPVRKGATSARPN